jgi:hypothetical protein
MPGSSDSIGMIEAFNIIYTIMDHSSLLRIAQIIAQRGAIFFPKSVPIINFRALYR